LTRPRRIPRTGQSRNADLPVHLRVVGLEILVGDGPVGERGSFRRTMERPLLEVDRSQPPEIAREVNAAAADVVRVAEASPLDDLRLLVFVLPERLGMSLASSPDESFVLGNGPFVVLEVLRSEPRALLQHDDREACCREFLRDNTAGRSGPDDDEVNRPTRGKRRLPDHQRPSRAYSAS